MKEIKFRGLSLYEERQWIYGLIFKSGSEGQWTEVQTENGQSVFVDPETISQYTGLKDKNGREIYEGDIVEFNGGCHRVAWSARYCGYRLFGSHASYGMNNYHNLDYEVIGNQFEQPELLIAAREVIAGFSRSLFDCPVEELSEPYKGAYEKLDEVIERWETTP